MSKKDKIVFDIVGFQNARMKNSIQMDPADYVNEKMPIFAANVNLRRQIPEIRDGLIPVQRRILYAMFVNKNYKGNVTKSANAVGATIAHLHPHGDTSIYKSLVLMGQPFKNLNPLIERHGNFGSAADGNGFAHMRYTQCAISDFAYDCYFSEWHLGSPENDAVVDWCSNSDDTGLEPLYFPAKYPVFLIRYLSGLGIGAYSGTVAFSVRDAFNAVIKLIKNPDAKFELLPEDIQGCDLINAECFKNVLDSTDVTARFRSKYEIVRINGKDVIQITSCPFEVNPSTIKETIVGFAQSGKLPTISDIHLASDEFGISFKLQIVMKNGCDPTNVINSLFKQTQLEKSFALKYQFVDLKKPVQYTLRIAILEWIRMRKVTLLRNFKSKKCDVVTRILFLDPLIRVIESGEIEKFIDIVRHNKKDAAIEKIMRGWNLYDYQAEKIIDVKISDLSLDKLKEFKDELKARYKELDELSAIIDNHHRLDDLIISQLEDGIKKYGSDRRSQAYQDMDPKSNIPETNHYIIFTDKYVKKLTYDDRGYKVGRVEGRIRKIIQANNLDTLLIFTKDGRCNPVKVSDIPESVLNNVGYSYTQCKCSDNWFIDAINISEKPTDKYVVIVTKKGNIQKVEYLSLIDRQKPFIIVKLLNNDEVVGVCMYNENDKVTLFSEKGRCSIYSLDDFEDNKSFNTKGVIGSEPDDGDSIIGIKRIFPEDKYLVALTLDGCAKKITMSDFPKTKRNGCMRELISDNYQLVDVETVDENSSLLISTSVGEFAIDPININAINRLGRPEKIINIDDKAYSFKITSVKSNN